MSKLMQKKRKGIQRKLINLVQITLKLTENMFKLGLNKTGPRILLYIKICIFQSSIRWSHWASNWLEDSFRFLPCIEIAPALWNKPGITFCHRLNIRQSTSCDLLISPNKNEISASRSRETIIFWWWWIFDNSISYYNIYML